MLLYNEVFPEKIIKNHIFFCVMQFKVVMQIMEHSINTILTLNVHTKLLIHSAK